jgi:hypothetical protein
LAAVAAGVATVITGAVVAIPSWVKETVSPESRITFVAQRERQSCTSYVIPKKIGEIGRPPAIDKDTDWSDWALGLGGAEADHTKVLITVRGTGEGPVTITGLTFSVKERGPALHGSAVAQRCGDETVGRYAEVDLDQEPPRIVTSSSSSEGYWGDDEWRTTPLRFPYQVTRTENESLLIIARTKQYRAWIATLSWTDGDKTGNDVVDFGGTPFRTSSTVNAKSYYSADQEWKEY